MIKELPEDLIVSVEGGSEELRELVYEATFFYLKLLLKRKIKNINIDIELVDNLRKKEKIFGDAITGETYKDIIIRLNNSKTNYQLVLLNLAHEMVHAKQYIRKELVDLNLTTAKWKGENIVHEDYHYFDHPWEIDATGRERGLYFRFISNGGYQKQKWVKEFPRWMEEYKIKP